MNQRSSAKLPVSPRPPKSRIYDSALDPHDAAHRVSAFIYGNILVLAALVTINPHAIHDGHGVLIVLGTGLSTYLAHCVAEQQEMHVLHGKRVQMNVVIRALRNSVPILTSTSLPSFALALGYWYVLDAETAWYTAVGVVAVRLLLNGALVAKYRGEKVTLRTMLSGIVLAVVALAVALLKAHLTH